MSLFEVLEPEDTFVSTGDARQDMLNVITSLPRLDAPTTHHFTEGLYTRVMTAYEGTVIVGKRHKNKTLNILMQGEMSVYLDDNKKATIMKAPHVFESEAGVSKAIYAVTDIVMANVHITNETDLDKIEEEFIVPEEMKWVG
tara:strand:- start:443 stop:868 length:426 start_codon:yes stop_codon:yes gene_type:complete